MTCSSACGCRAVRPPTPVHAADVAQAAPLIAAEEFGVQVHGSEDISSEMIMPVAPILLTAVLGAPVAAAGLIDCVAESTASVLGPSPGRSPTGAGLASHSCSSTTGSPSRQRG